jgi:hypothetical protein
MCADMLSDSNYNFISNFKRGCVKSKKKGTFSYSYLENLFVNNGFRSTLFNHADLEENSR